MRGWGSSFPCASSVRAPPRQVPLFPHPDPLRQFKPGSVPQIAMRQLRAAHGFLLPLFAGHDPAHKFSEQRHGEGDVAVGGAIDHAFRDEFGTHRAEPADVDASSSGNIAGAVWTRPELGGDAQKVLFAGSQEDSVLPIYTHIYPGRGIWH